MLIAIREAAIPIPDAAAPDVFVIGLGEAAQAWTMTTVHHLRQKGLEAAYDLKGRSMKAQMRDANRAGAPHVVIVGEAELSRQQAIVKHMESSTQESVSFDELAAYLTGTIHRKAPID